MAEDFWIERAQTAEAKLSTMQGNVDTLKAKCRYVKDMLCARETTEGAMDIDFDALVQKLPVDQALELRAAIDQHHRISGEPGKKPRVKLGLPAAG